MLEVLIALVKLFHMAWNDWRVKVGVGRGNEDWERYKRENPDWERKFAYPIPAKGELTYGGGSFGSENREVEKRNSENARGGRRA